MKKIIIVLIFALMSFAAMPVIAHAGEPGVINSSALSGLLTKGAVVNSSGNNSVQSQSGNLKNLGAKAYILGFYQASVVGFHSTLPTGPLSFCKTAVIKLSLHSQSYLTEKCVKGAIDAFKLGRLMNEPGQ